MLVWLAGAAGTALRVLPLMIGIALLVAGLGMIYMPLAFVASGLIILVVWVRWTRRRYGSV